MKFAKQKIRVVFSLGIFFAMGISDTYAGPSDEYHQMTLKRSRKFTKNLEKALRVAKKMVPPQLQNKVRRYGKKLEKLQDMHTINEFEKFVLASSAERKEIEEFRKNFRDSCAKMVKTLDSLTLYFL